MQIEQTEHVINSAGRALVQFKRAIFELMLVTNFYRTYTMNCRRVIGNQLIEWRIDYGCLSQLRKRRKVDLICRAKFNYVWS